MHAMNFVMRTSYLLVGAQRPRHVKFEYTCIQCIVHNYIHRRIHKLLLFLKITTFKRM